LSTDLMDSGMEFQMTGPATEKALSPRSLVTFYYWTIWSYKLSLSEQMTNANVILK